MASQSAETCGRRSATSRQCQKTSARRAGGRGGRRKSRRVASPPPTPTRSEIACPPGIGQEPLSTRPSPSYLPVVMSGSKLAVGFPEDSRVFFPYEQYRDELGDQAHMATDDFNSATSE